jgi:hypothetical protein
MLMDVLIELDLGTEAQCTMELDLIDQLNVLLRTPRRVAWEQMVYDARVREMGR